MRFDRDHLRFLVSRAWLLGGVLAVGLAGALATIQLAGCANETGCAVGSDGCACSTSGGCLPGLACQSGICVGGPATGRPEGGGLTPADPGPGGPTPGGPTPGGPTPTMSAGHQWCLSVKGKIVNSPPTEAMWASGPNDAWFLTNHGKAIDGVPPPYSPPGTPPPVIGVGYWPVLIHWDGQTFCASGPTFLGGDLQLGALWSMWGSGPNDVWAVGDRGGAIHWDGRSWQVVELSAEKDQLVSIGGTGPSDVYVVGEAGTGGYGLRGGELFRWNGSKWITIRSEGRGLNFSAYSHLWVDAGGRIWMTWIESSTNGPAGCAVMSLASNQLRCDLGSDFGNGWQSVRHLHGAGQRPWVVVKETRADTYSIWTLENGKWRAFDFPEAIYTVQARSDNDVWASGASGVWHWNGSAWTPPASASAAIKALWMSKAGELWGWGPQGIAIWTGQTWRRLSR